jgi:hypothetical protein
MEYIILYWNWVQNLHLHRRDFHVFFCLILFCLLYRNSRFVLVIMFDKRDKFHSMMPKATPLTKTSLHFYVNPTPQARDLCISISWSLTEHSGRWIYTILCESFTWWSHSVECLNFSPEKSTGIMARVLENQFEIQRNLFHIFISFFPTFITFTALSRSLVSPL